MRLVLCLLVAAVASGAPLELPREREKWVTLRVDEFTFVSSISAAETAGIARDLLRMREAVGQITKLNVRSSKPTHIFIFGSERTFAPYRDAVMQRKMEKVGGLFATGETRNFILMRGDSDDVDRTIYHELTHYFVRNTLSGLPLWVSEGMAEYYSTFRTSGDEVHIGRPIPDHVQWLRSHELIPLRELLETTVDSPIYGESDRQGAFYAQSWALFHHLMMSGDERRAQLGRFLSLVSDGSSVDDAFTAAFQTTYEELEKELRKYVRSLLFRYAKYSLDELKPREVPKPELLSRDELLFELGHLLAHAGPEVVEDAARFLGEAIAVNNMHAQALADLGRIHHLAGRTDEGNRAFERAMRLGSEDAEVHLLAGMTLRERWPLKARQALRRSTELDPGSALAWMELGATYVVTDDAPAPGIAALEKALALAPGDVHATFGLVQLYARAGKRAEATWLIDSVLVRAATRDMIEHARKAVLVSEVRDAEGLANGGKWKEAEALARSISARNTDASLGKYLAELIAQMERLEKENRTVDTINAAVAKANAGQYAEALAILEGVLPQITDATVLEQAKKLRADLALWAKRR